MRFVLTLAAAAALLVACGGSDSNDGDNQATVPGNPGNVQGIINASNYVAVAQAALSTTASLLGSAETALGAQTSDAGLLVKFSQAQLLGSLRRSSAGAQQAVGVVTTEEEQCSGGGKLVTQDNDANNNGRPDQGDSFTISAQNCVEDGNVLNGQIAVTLGNVSGNIDGDVFNVAATAVYTNFSIASAGERVVTNGTLNLGIAQQGENSQDLDVRTPSLTYAVTSAGRTGTVALQNYEATLRTRPAGAQQVYTSSVNGTILNSDFASQSLTVRTTQPFVRLSSQPYADRGELLVTDRSGAKVRAVVTSATTLTIDLDANADDRYETSVNKLWREML